MSNPAPAPPVAPNPVMEEAALVANAINTTKIPDPIKNLHEYSGDRTSLYRWITTVDNILETYQTVSHTAIYRVWGQIIRNKIVGDADKALVARNVGNWDDIKDTLIEYFGDRRDIATITQQIPYLRQDNKSLEDYYHYTNQLIADINQKISLDPVRIITVMYKQSCEYWSPLSPQASLMASMGTSQTW